MERFKKFVLPSGNTLVYSPLETFPPGSGTLEMAHSTAHYLENINGISEKSSKDINVLELGTGPGTFLVELVSRMRNPNGINLFGLDIDSLSVRLTRHNLKKTAERYNLQLSSQIILGSWAVGKTWDNFDKHFYNLIYFNPPYFDSKTTTPEKLANTPKDMVFAEGLGGLYHYRRVLPILPDHLSQNAGSAIIFRIPGYLDDKDLMSLEQGSLGRVLYRVLEKIPDPKSVAYYKFRSTSGEHHFCKITKE